LSLRQRDGAILWTQKFFRKGYRIFVELPQGYRYNAVTITNSLVAC